MKMLPKFYILFHSDSESRKYGRLLFSVIVFRNSKFELTCLGLHNIYMLDTIS